MSRPEMKNQAVCTVRSVSEDNGHAAIEAEPLVAPNLTWQHRLSWITTLTLLLSFLAVPIVIGLLCFLWSNPSVDLPHPLWRNLVLGGWTVQSITISTVVLRTAVAGSASIGTSMLAAIILEGRGVSLHASAPVSIFRYVNSGPQSLFLALFGSLTSNVVCTCTITLLLCTTLVLQFTSTLLASDLRVGTIVSPFITNTTLSGISTKNLNVFEQLFGPPYWMSNPQSFQTFAEYHEPIPILENTDTNAVCDTGITHRAFLPLPDHSARTSIRSFKGAATVLDSRMVCIRPNMQPDFAIGYTNTTGWLHNGMLTPSVWVKGMLFENFPALPADGLGEITYTLSSDNTTIVNMTYFQQLPLYSSDHEDEWSVREKLLVYGPGLVSSLDPRFDHITPENFSHFTYVSPTYDLFSSGRYNVSNPHMQVNNLSYYIRGDPAKLLTGRSHILLNVSYGTGSHNFTKELGVTTKSRVLYTLNDTSNPLRVAPQNEWLVFTLPQAPSFRVAMTLCFDSFISTTTEITASADNLIQEPGLSWDVSTQVAVTRDLRHQLGVLGNTSQSSSSTSSSPSSRGLLSLLTSISELQAQVNASLQLSNGSNSFSASNSAHEFLKMYIRDKWAWGLGLCTKCAMAQSDPYGNITYPYTGGVTLRVFQDTLRDTNNMSLAWQAFVFLMARMAYYDWIQYFDIQDHPMISWFDHAQFPQRTRGLMIVAIFLAVHFAIVVAVAAKFFLRTRTSRIGDNAWQCLAQMQGPTLERHLKVSTMAKDNAVKDNMSTQQIDERLVKLKFVNRLSAPRVMLTEERPCTDQANGMIGRRPQPTP